MTSKVQGEGDYEAGRRYDERARKFVADKESAGEKLEGNAEEAQAELTDAEREALKHAKAGDQDRRDAETLRKLESNRSESSPGGSERNASDPSGSDRSEPDRH